MKKKRLNNKEVILREILKKAIFYLKLI